MKFSKVMLIAAAILLVTMNAAFSQIQAVGDVEKPIPVEQGAGAVTPYFWVGAKALVSAGYNLETGANGLRTHWDDTYASFNVGFIDSRYQAPRLTEIGANRDIWSGHFKLLNYTCKINSWTDYDKMEIHKPTWMAEIQGKGFHIGILSQAGNLIDVTAPNTADIDNGSTSQNNPVPTLSSGGMVLNLGNGDVMDSDYILTSNDATSVTYTAQKKDYEGGNYGANNGTSGAILYTGYDVPDLFEVYLSTVSRGDVTQDPKYNGWAGAVDFKVTPFGTDTSEETPYTPVIRGNFLAGTGWDDNPIGMGFKIDNSLYLGNNLILTPTAAFDGAFANNNADDDAWAVGGGLLFQFSGKRWVNDDWNEYTQTEKVHCWSGSVYEYSKILKFAYAQVYASYSEKDDVDIAFKFEEPDGIAGFHENLGALAEVRVNNVVGVSSSVLTWSVMGRVQYDLKDHTVCPYLRAYFNSKDVLKLRTGVYLNGIIPYAGFEIAYTSRNLNEGASSTAPSDIFDAGRIELLVVLKSDEKAPKTPKRMSDWNYK